MNSVQFEENSVSQSRKKGLSACLVCLLSVFCAVFVLLAAAVSFVALSAPQENTFEVFGYKFFCVSENIGDNIKGGSLVVVKDTDADDYYTEQTLLENTVLVIENLGGALKNDAVWIALCFMVPPMLIFFLILAGEIKKLVLKREAQKLSGEFVISESSEMDVEHTIEV